MDKHRSGLLSEGGVILTTRYLILVVKIAGVYAGVALERAFRTMDVCDVF